MSWFDSVVEKAFAGAIVTAFVGLAGVGVFVLEETLRSNGEADYCYVEMWSPGQMAPQYQLHTHRPWRPDRIIGNFTTLDEAATEADRMHCTMGKR